MTIYNRASGVSVGAITFLLFLTLLEAKASAVTNLISDYAITERTDHAQVWKKVTSTTNSFGKTIYHTNSFTQLGTGLNHKQNGQWIPSSEDIQITAEGAVATNTQHHVKLSANLNTTAGIQVLTPKGQLLQSTVAGLSYYDYRSGSNVIIAQIQDSIGQLLPNGHQAIYTNALIDTNTGFLADVLYSHKKASFAQDIVLRTQPPDPAVFGLDIATTRMQVWTEFFNTTDPTITSKEINLSKRGGGHKLVDQTLNFGSMRMMRGKAYPLASLTNSAPNSGTLLVPVGKQWRHIGNRTFLVEEVPLNLIADSLDKLPTGVKPTNAGSGQSFFRLRNPEAEKTAKTKAPTMTVAKWDQLSKPGYLVDYELSGGETDFTFQSDTTYFVTDILNLYGTTTIEGGTVVKNADSAGGLTVIDDEVTWLTSQYRPAVFTCTNDNSVGETLPGASGIPSLCQDTYMYVLNGGLIHDARFCYAYNAYSGCASDVELWNCQFVDCSHPITANSGTSTLGLHNVLITMDDSINVDAPYSLDRAVTSYADGLAISAENITVDIQNHNFTIEDYGSTASISLTNCIILATNLIDCGYYDPSGTTITTNTCYIDYTEAAGVFQTVGGGFHYLNTNSPLRGVGTINVSSGLLLDLTNKTTYPPFVFSNYVFGMSETLYPLVSRENNTTNLDLGYHYDALDYAIGYSFIVSNATLTLSGGVSTTFYGTNNGSGQFGIYIGGNGSVISEGTPINLNYFTAYNEVQETIANYWSEPTTAFLLLNFSDPETTVIKMRFTDWSSLAQDCFYISDSNNSTNNYTTIRDSQLHGGQMYSWTGINLTNCLFERVVCDIYGGVFEPTLENFVNNLFWGGSADFYFGNTNDVVHNNMFYKVNPFTDESFDVNYAEGNNGYYGNGGTTLLITSGSDKNLTTDPGYLAGPLGNYYIPTTNVLVNAGNTTADVLGYFHFTTRVDEVKETNSVMDIGFHYVALNSYGLPDDTDGDGIPDYVEDANGNGLVNSGETSWTNPNDLGLNVIITEPKNNSIIP